MKTKYLFYPGHGVGRITGIETKEILGKKIKFIRMEILGTGMVVMVPATNLKSVGVRKLMSKREAKQCWDLLTSPGTSRPNRNGQNWSARYRECMEKIKSGVPSAIASVIVDLEAFDDALALSFGERKMLDAATFLLRTEIAIVLGLGEEFFHVVDRLEGRAGGAQ